MSVSFLTGTKAKTLVLVSSITFLQSHRLSRFSNMLSLLTVSLQIGGSSGHKTLMNSEDRKTPVSVDLRDVNVGA